MPLDWTGCRNARDCGGLPTVIGGRLRDHALIRSDHHGRLTPAAVAAVRAARPARILDLRWPRECERDPSPFAGDTCYRRVPLLDEVLDYEPLADTYRLMLDHNRPRIADGFRALADAPPGTVVVHCHGGRDRTGVLVALALAVAGVAEAAIVADYARTPGAQPVAMTNTLRHLVDAYGGAESYLERIGITRAEIRAVRRRLTGP